MQALSRSSHLVRTARRIAPLTLGTLLAACGGGGDGTPSGEPTVSSATAGAVKYSQSLLITINGTGLDSGLTVTSAGCTGMAFSTQPTEVSTATTAYYRCTASAMGANQVNVLRASDSTSLKKVPFTVAVPQVTMTVKNTVGGGFVDGQLIFTLAPDKTPLTVNNFLAYVNSGFYDGTIFHRVVAGFVMQGGGYLPITPGNAPELKAPLRPAIPLEVGRGLSNVQWTIAMARTSALDSATAQFFVNVVDNEFLDTSGGGYAVFGTLSTGTDVATAILGAPCAPLAGFSDPGACVPNPNMVIVAALQTQ